LKHKGSTIANFSAVWELVFGNLMWRTTQQIFKIAFGNPERGSREEPVLSQPAARHEDRKPSLGMASGHV